MNEPTENPDAAPLMEPTGVVNVRIEKVEHLAQSGGYGVAKFHLDDEEKEVLVRASYVEVGDRVVFVPNNSVLPDEPEFSNLGSARRRLRARNICGTRSDGMLISYDDVASIMARRATRLAQTSEEVAALTRGADAEYMYDAARAALTEIPLGVDLGESLGIFPYIDPDEEVTVQITPAMAEVLGIELVPPEKSE